MYKRLEKVSAEDEERFFLGRRRFETQTQGKAGGKYAACPDQGFKHIITLIDVQTFEHCGHLSRQLG